MIFVFLGIPMLWGTSQMGIIVYDSIEVSNAANAGALYGSENISNANNPTKIQAAAQADATDFPSKSLSNSALAVTTNHFYFCADKISGDPTAELTVPDSCSASGTAHESVEFVQVQTSATVTPILKFPGVPSSYTVTGHAVLAVQQ